MLLSLLDRPYLLSQTPLAVKLVRNLRASGVDKTGGDRWRFADLSCGGAYISLLTSQGAVRYGPWCPAMWLMLMQCSTRLGLIFFV